MADMPPLNGLRAFEATARLGSVTRAAGELGVTPSAVSHQLRSLEEHLSAKLFHRAPGGIKLTDLGGAYFPAITSALQEITRATGTLFVEDNTPRITISAMPVFVVKWLVPRLGDFQRRHPEIDVRISSTYGLVDLSAGDVDLGIRWGSGDWPDLDVELLAHENVRPVCSPSLADGPHPLEQPADLHHHTLLHMAFGREDWETWCRLTGVDGIDTLAGLRFDEPLAAIEAAIDGLGVALGPSALVGEDMSTGRLVAAFETEIPLETAYYVVSTDESRRRSAVRVFRDWLFDAMGGSANRGT